MSNQDYLLQIERRDATAPSPFPTRSSIRAEFSPTPTIPPTRIINTFKSPPSFPFSISASNSVIDFGIFSPTDPTLRTMTISVTNNASAGFAVFSYESFPLRASDASSLIPDTTCDHGTCTEKTADTWTSVLVYGLGYRCDNLNLTPCVDFADNTAYKHYANFLADEMPTLLLSGRKSLAANTSQITNKLNVSNTQIKTSYHNSLVFFGIPDF